jgi:hypothetical protein
MKTIKLTALTVTLILPLSASAGNLTPLPSYRTECGSCHVPYPPDLLSAGGLFSAGGWREIMGGLRAHFGGNAELEEPVRQQIEQYLVEHAGSSDRRFGSRTDPTRITTTLWFRRTHGEVRSYFANSQVGSPSNCQACHPKAEYGGFAKEDVTLPGLPRR